MGRNRKGMKKIVHVYKIFKYTKELVFVQRGGGFNEERICSIRMSLKFGIFMFQVS